MNEPIISIIVPIYKAESYLVNCINSILSQSFKEYELILVDDGSPDCCGEICDEYEKKDSRIVVIHQNNQGTNHARKNGVTKSRGQYIFFVDPDDLLPKDSLSILISNMDTQTDIIIGNYQTTLLTGEKTITNYLPTIIKNRDEYITNLCTGKLPSSPWGKLYRKELFNNYIFDLPPNEIKRGQDYIMNIRVAFFLKNTIKIIPNIVYNYIQCKTSVIMSYKTSIKYEKKYNNLLLEVFYKFNKERELWEIMLHTKKSAIQTLLSHSAFEPDNPWIKKTLKEIKPILSTTKDKIYFQLISIPFTYKIIQLYRLIKR